MKTHTRVNKKGHLGMSGETEKKKQNNNNTGRKLKIGRSRAKGRIRQASSATVVNHETRGHLQVVLCGRLTFRRASLISNALIFIPAQLAIGGTEGQRRIAAPSLLAQF